MYFDGATLHTSSLDARHTLPSANVALTRCTRVIVAAGPTSSSASTCRDASCCNTKVFFDSFALLESMLGSTGNTRDPTGR